MGRKKIAIKAIQDEKLRYITFNKRKGGLLKKACELAMLCKVKVYLAFHDVYGNLITFSTQQNDQYLNEAKKLISDKKMYQFTKQDYPNFFSGRKQIQYQKQVNSTSSNEESQEFQQENQIFQAADENELIHTESESDNDDDEQQYFSKSKKIKYNDQIRNLEEKQGTKSDIEDTGLVIKRKRENSQLQQGKNEKNLEESSKQHHDPESITLNQNTYENNLILYEKNYIQQQIKQIQKPLYQLQPQLEQKQQQQNNDKPDIKPEQQQQNDQNQQKIATENKNNLNNLNLNQIQQNINSNNLPMDNISYQMNYYNQIYQFQQNCQQQQQQQYQFQQFLLFNQMQQQQQILMPGFYNNDSLKCQQIPKLPDESQKQFQKVIKNDQNSSQNQFIDFGLKIIQQETLNPQYLMQENKILLQKQ